MKYIKLLFTSIVFCVLNSCATLLPVTTTGNTSLNGYKYACVTSTNEISSSIAVIYGGHGSSIGKSVNPSNIISGIMMKNGFIILPCLSEETNSRTVIVNYGETGRRNLLLGYTIEITIQIIDAETKEIICTSTAEGIGETESDDIRIAITRALNKIFEE